MFFRFVFVTALVLPQLAFAQADWRQWAVSVESNIVLDSLGIDAAASRLMPFQPSQVQFSLEQRGANDFRPSISVIARELKEPMVTEVLNTINSQLPDMGCRDFIAVEHLESAAQDDRRSSRTSIGYPFRIYGAERACDWPHGTYARYSGPVRLSLSVSAAETDLSISPDIDIGSIKINWRDYGKIGREIFRVADDLADFFGGDLGFEAAMAQIDQALDLGQYEEQASSLLSAYAASIDLEDVVPGGAVDSIAWSPNTGFFREVHTREECGFGVSGPIVVYHSTVDYFLNIQIDVTSPLTEAEARLFSAFASNFLQEYSTGGARFVQPLDRALGSRSLKPADCY